MASFGSCPLHVLRGLKTRGVRGMLITLFDGLAELGEMINTT
jgi:hypothetical protein